MSQNKLMQILTFTIMTALLCSTVVTVQAKKSEPVKTASCSELPAKVWLAAIPREKRECEVRLDSRAGLTGFPSPIHYQKGEKLTGTVKWFNPQKGFGFISPDTQQRDVHVHFSAIQVPPRAPNTFRILAEGQRVQFEIEDGPKGPRAVNVVKI